MPKPYAFINDEMLNYVYLRDHLAGLPLGGRAKFDQLNAHILNEVILPGQIVIVGDDATQMCTPEETELMRLAQDVRLSMIGTGYASSNVMTQNFDLLQSIMAYGSIGVGSSTAAWPGTCVNWKPCSKTPKRCTNAGSPLQSPTTSSSPNARRCSTKSRRRWRVSAASGPGSEIPER
jgi:hypothetical protein